MLDYDPIYTGCVAVAAAGADRSSRAGEMSRERNGPDALGSAASRDTMHATTIRRSQASADRQHADVSCGPRRRPARAEPLRRSAGVVLQGQRRRAPRTWRGARRAGICGRRRRRGGDRGRVPRRFDGPAAPHRHGHRQRVFRSQIREAQLPEPCRVEAPHLRAWTGAGGRSGFRPRARPRRRSSAPAASSGSAKSRQASARCVTVSRTSSIITSSSRRIVARATSTCTITAPTASALRIEVLLAEGDVMTIQFGGFGRALRNPVTIATAAARASARAVARMTAVKICRFLAGDSVARIGLVER